MKLKDILELGTYGFNPDCSWNLQYGQLWRATRNESFDEILTSQNVTMQKSISYAFFFDRRFYFNCYDRGGWQYQWTLKKWFTQKGERIIFTPRQVRIRHHWLHWRTYRRARKTQTEMILCIYIDYSIEPQSDIAFLDMKSFYASVECVDRGLHPLYTSLCVMSRADNSAGLILASLLCLRKYSEANVGRSTDLPLT